MSKTREIIAEKRGAREQSSPNSHALPEIRRCTACGVRKALWAFYRDRKSRGGYRRECKRCRNRARAAWARRRYVPKTGRRYRSKAGGAQGV